MRFSEILIIARGGKLVFVNDSEILAFGFVAFVCI